MIEASIFQLSTSESSRSILRGDLRERNCFYIQKKEINWIYIYIQTSHPNKKPPKPILVGPLLKPMARLPGSMEVYSEDELRGMLAREISKRPWPTVGTVVSIAHDAWRDWGM